MGLKLFCGMALSAALAVTAQAQIKVACVGNSITEGYGIWDQKKYPEHLQDKLGDSYEVKNFGKSSMTFYKGGSMSYWSTTTFTEAYSYAPDIVVIELGTNDSKYFYDGAGSSSGYNYNFYEYSGVKLDDFYTDYEALIDTFAHQSQAPKIYATLQPYAQNTEWGIVDTAIVNTINPLIKEVAEKNGAELIDLHTLFYDHAWLQADSVHPNETGAEELAKIVASAILNTPIESSSAEQSSSSGELTSSSQALSSSSSQEITNIFQSKYISESKITAQGSTIHIENFQGEIAVFDLNGNLIKRAHSHGNMQIQAEFAGSYIVKAGRNVHKVILK